jgi:ACS family sodium-dependent inorganic phosphate cotransporter-like MFS transporter 5
MFGTYLLLTQLPTYMKEVLKFDIKSVKLNSFFLCLLVQYPKLKFFFFNKNGGLSSLPYIVFWLVTIVSSAVGDKLIQSKKLSKTAVRKIFNTLGLLIPAVSMVGLAFVTCSNPYMGVALLTVGLGATGCAYGAGFIVNYNDIAGSYAGFSFGVANTFGTIPGFVAPYMVGIITKNVKQFYSMKPLTSNEMKKTPIINLF